MRDKNGSVSPGPRRDTSQKRRSIIDAAIREFSERGYDGSSMDRIAELAGASKRTVYNHFPSKDELFQAVIDGFGSQMASLKTIRYDPVRSLEEQLSAFADAEIAVTSSPVWMGFIKALLTVFMRDPKLAREAISRHMGEEDSLTVWMREAGRDGKLEIENPALAARVFSSMLGGAFTWPAVYQGSLDAASIAPLKDELINTFLCRFRR